MDLDETISKLRAGGVTSAEFYEDGSVKSITLGAEQGATPPADDGDSPPARNPLRAMALKLASGQNLVKRDE